MKLAIYSVACLVTASLTAQQAPPVPVYVTSVGAVNGMTDPNRDNQDSVKDLRDSLREYRQDLAVVDAREAAVIIVTVQSREKAQLTAGVFPGTAGRDCTVRVRLHVGELDTELTGSAQGGTLASGGAWKKAAGKVAKQVREWVHANRDKITVP